MDADIGNPRWAIKTYCEIGYWNPTPPFFELETNLNPKDYNWNYELPVGTQILSPSQLHSRGDETEIQTRNSTVLMKSVRVTNENVILSKEPIPPNRMTMSDNPDNFIYISFNKLKFRRPGERNWDFELTSKYIEAMLTFGISLSGTRYVFFGHSNSQLKSRCCYLRMLDEKRHQSLLLRFLEMLKPPKHPMDDRINSCGNFKKIKTVATRAKRISLLFTACESTVIINPEETKIIDDRTRRDETFSDGCGCIDIEYIKTLYRNFPPSVFQIRYQGLKGVLVATHNSEIRRLLNNDRPVVTKVIDFLASSSRNEMEPLPKILFRKSMDKFSKCFDTTSLCIIDCSRPFKYGYLNSDLITLLSTIGIDDDVFERKFHEYFALLRSCTTDRDEAIRFSILKGRLDLTRRLRQSYLIPNDVKKKLERLQMETYKSFCGKENKTKIRIWVPQSRLLFGVCDFTGKLKKDECFIQITVASEGHYEPEIRRVTGNVVVGRNPCLHPGDIKILSAVEDFEGLNHLVDCIVFSVRGKIPAAAMMSGGDLDGDKFFVSWDPDLIPDVTYKSADYSQFEPQLQEKEKITQKDLLDYFAYYNNFALGRTKNLYMNWVRGTEKRALSQQCLRLNAIHSKCVDGEKIDIPVDLRHYPPPVQPEFIVDVLERSTRNALPREVRDNSYD